MLDGDVMAQEVADLIVRTGCGVCVPWAKHDGVVGQLKDILPHQRAGYVLVDRGLPGDRSTRNLLRMPDPEVGLFWLFSFPTLFLPLGQR